MSTRSLIGHKNKDGSIIYVYCHYDGYIDGVGLDLKQYSDSEEVLEMISHGDRSQVNGPYYKDRGEEGVQPNTVKSELNYITSEQMYIDAAGWADYLYLFKNDEWLVCQMSRKQKNFVPY